MSDGLFLNQAVTTKHAASVVSYNEIGEDNEASIQLTYSTLQYCLGTIRTSSWIGSGSGGDTCTIYLTVPVGFTVTGYPSEEMSVNTPINTLLFFEVNQNTDIEQYITIKESKFDVELFSIPLQPSQVYEFVIDIRSIDDVKTASTWIHKANIYHRPKFDYASTWTPMEFDSQA